MNKTNDTKGKTQVKFASGKNVDIEKDDPLVTVLATKQGFESSMGRMVEAGETFEVRRSVAREGSTWFRAEDDGDLELTDEEKAAAETSYRAQTGATSGGLGPNPNPEIAPAGNTSQTRTPSDKGTGPQANYNVDRDENTKPADAKAKGSDLA